MTKTPTPASHAVNTATISADLRGIDGAQPADVAQQDPLLLAVHLRELANLAASGSAMATLCVNAANVLGAQHERIEELERYQAAFNEWHDKTEWVQKTTKLKELGKHRADVLRERIEELTAQPARECLQQSAATAEQAAYRLKRVRHGWEVWGPKRENATVYDNDVSHEANMLRGLFQALQAVPPAPAGVAVPASQDQYLCQAWGETDLPAVAIVDGLDGVRAFLIEQWLGDEDASHDDGTKALPAAMQEMQDEWAEEGEAWKWEAAFEIGGVSVQKVGHSALVAAPAQAVAVPNWEAAAREMSVKIAGNCDTAPQLVFPYLYLGLKKLFAAAPAQAVAVPADARAPEQWIDDPHDIEQGMMLNPEWVRAQEHATQLAGQGQAYSIDADPEGIRARVADAITGVLAFGAQGGNTPPPEHWLTPFWMAARFEAAQINALRELMNGQLEQVQAPFQQRVQPWLLECFGAEIAGDKQERNHRFLEEAVELVQANGCTASEAHQLVDYVFGRPVGEPAQEVGGVMVTLAALCLATGLDMHQAGEVELDRIWGKVDQIRAKQAAKPKHSPLPAAPAQAQEDAPAGWEGISSLPNCDDLIWLYCQDTNTVDGPVVPSPSYVDSWTHWAFAEAPSTKAIDAARAAQG